MPTVLGALRNDGCAVVTDVLTDQQIERTRDGLYRIQIEIERSVGEEKLQRAGELGVLRIPMLFDPYFLTFLEIPEVLAVIDNTVSSTAILHLQNGFISPPMKPENIPDLFQNTFHRDFPRVLNGYMMSVNCFFPISDFSEKNGGTRIVPSSHQKEHVGDQEQLALMAVTVSCPAGAMIIFDPTLYHAAGYNTSPEDRLAVNHQFTRSYVKQQIDYPRSLGEHVLNAPVKERTRQLLGYWTRVPSTLDEYYRPPDQRLYKAGQG